MNMLQFYIFAIFRSLFLREFYHDLIRNKNIYGLKYVLLIAIILSAPVSLQVRSMLNSMVGAADTFDIPSEEEIKNEIDYIAMQFPVVTFEKNNFVSKQEEPSYIYSKRGKAIVVIDPERKITDLSSFNNVILLRNNELQVIVAGTLSAVVSAADLYQSFQNYFVINDNNVPQFSIRNFFEDFYTIVTIPFPLILLFCFIWFSFRYFFKVLLYSFISGMIFSLMMKTEKFDFKLCMRIAVFTATPVAVFEFISFSLGYNIFTYTNMVYFITHILYIYFAVESYKKLTSNR